MKVYKKKKRKRGTCEQFACIMTGSCPNSKMEAEREGRNEAQINSQLELLSHLVKGLP